jgi:phosphatidylinositol dimannoside acyltransferase
MWPGVGNHTSAAQRYRGSGRPGEPVDRNPGAAERMTADPRAESWAERRTFLAYNAAWELTRRLPEPVVGWLADVAARVAFRRGGGARERLEANLARVVPPEAVEGTAREAFRSYARYWIEAFRAADMDPRDLDRRSTTDGFEHLDAALDEGRGAIVLLAHHGTWDLAAQWAETHGYHLAVVAEVVRPRRLFAKFVRLRETVGLEVVPLARGERMLGRLEEVLAANHMVGLLAERDLSGRGPVVRFFGEDARLPRGPLTLHRRTGAPVLPATMLQQPGWRWHIRMLPAVDLEGCDDAQAAQRIAHALEDLIRLDPAQWHAFQPIWSTDVERWKARKRTARKAMTRTRDGEGKRARKEAR